MNPKYLLKLALIFVVSCFIKQAIHAQLFCTDYVVQCNDPEKLNADFERELEYLDAFHFPANIAGPNPGSELGNTWLPINLETCFRDGEILKDISIDLNIIHNEIVDLQVILYPPTRLAYTGVPESILLADFGEVESTNIFTKDGQQNNLGLGILFEYSNIFCKDMLSKESVNFYSETSNDFTPQSFGNTWYLRISDKGPQWGFGAGEITSAEMVITTGFPSPIIDNEENFQNVTLIEEQCIEGACLNGNWQNKKVERTYSGVDQDGNIQMCTQTIEIESVPLEGLDIPQDVVLNCQDFTSSEDIGIEFLYNFNACWDFPGDIPTDCNLFVVWEDVEIPICSGVKILRDWTIGNFCSGEVVYHAQIIEYNDVQPPNIPDHIVVGSCSTFPITFEMLEIYDNCSSIESTFATVLVSGNPYLGNDEYEIVDLLNGESIVGLGFGGNTFEITATDACDNEITKDIVVEIRDDVPPVLMVQTEKSITLNSDGKYIIDVESIDLGTYDNCGYHVLQMKRNSLQDNWAETIELNATDVGDVLIDVRVYDAFGNVIIETVQVKVLMNAQMICTDYVMQCNDPEKLNGDFERVFEYEAAPEMPANFFGFYHEGDSIFNLWIPINIESCFKKSEILKDISIELNFISNTIYQTQVSLYPPIGLTNSGIPESILLAELGTVGSQNVFTIEGHHNAIGLGSLFDSSNISSSNMLSEEPINYLTENYSEEIPNALGQTWFIRVSDFGNDTIPPIPGQGGAFPTSQVSLAKMIITTGFPNPLIDNVENFEDITLVEEQCILGACVDGNWQNKKVERTYSGKDEDGNIQMCTQTITIESPPLGALNLPEDIVRSCQDFTSSEAIGLELLTDFNQCMDLPEEVPTDCNLFIVWEDVEVPVCGGVKLLREWTLGNFCTGQVTNHSQIIEYVDVESPTMPDEFSFESCDSIPITFEMFEITDECSNLESAVAKFLISGNPYLGNDQYETIDLLNDGVFMLRNVGITYVEITATDECGNVLIKDIEMELINGDDIAPTILLQESPSIFLNLDDTKTLNLDLIDAGTYDNCSKPVIELKRTLSLDDYQKTIELNASDIGYVLIDVRATDEAGNVSIEIIQVQVKLGRIITPNPPGLVLHTRLEQENTQKENLLLTNSPNPFKEQTNICLKNCSNVVNDFFVVYDVSGKLIYQKKITNDKNVDEICFWLDRGDLKHAGVYFYKLRGIGGVSKLVLMD